eukprot:g3089.t1
MREPHYRRHLVHDFPNLLAVDTHIVTDDERLEALAGGAGGVGDSSSSTNVVEDGDEHAADGPLNVHANAHACGELSRRAGRGGGRRLRAYTVMQHRYCFMGQNTEVRLFSYASLLENRGLRVHVAEKISYTAQRRGGRAELLLEEDVDVDPLLPRLSASHGGGQLHFHPEQCRKQLHEQTTTAAAGTKAHQHTPLLLNTQQSSSSTRYMVEMRRCFQLLMSGSAWCSAAVQIQRVFRGYRKRSRFRKLARAVTRLQAVARRFLWEREVERHFVQLRAEFNRVCWRLSQQERSARKLQSGNTLVNVCRIRVMSWLILHTFMQMIPKMERLGIICMNV